MAWITPPDIVRRYIRHGHDVKPLAETGRRSEIDMGEATFRSTLAPKPLPNWANVAGSHPQARR